MPEYLVAHEKKGLEGALGYVVVAADDPRTAWSAARGRLPSDERIVLLVDVRDAGKLFLNEGWSARDWMDDVARSQAEEEERNRPRHPEDRLVRKRLREVTAADIVELGGRLVIEGAEIDHLRTLVAEAAVEIVLRAKDPDLRDTAAACANAFVEFLIDRADPKTKIDACRSLRSLPGFDVDLAQCPAYVEAMRRWGDSIDPELLRARPDLFGRGIDG